jgi:hypothetical protein
MADSRDKRAVDIQDSIRQILIRDWDPIGVRDNPKLQDEYDSYIGPVYRILAGSRSAEELMDFLHRTGRGFSMPCESPEQLRPLALRLLALDVKL